MPLQPREDLYRIEAVDRALVLLALLRDRGRLSVTDAASELGVAPSTAHRMLSTLCARGWAVQGARRLYQPGPALVATTRVGYGIPTVTRRLRPYLADLFERVRESVHTVVLTGADVHFVDGIEGDQALRVGLRVGARMPAGRTAGGKAMLAELDPAAVRALYPVGLTTSSDGRATDLARLEDELAVVRERGHAVHEAESEIGVTAVGVSVGNAGGEHLVAFTVAVPTVRFEAARVGALADALHAVADRARRELAAQDAEALALH